MAYLRKPICFIAMAFDHDDTDALYENQILPTLQRNNVIPVIINRIQSNEDINIQIIDQLEKADFCITDLTYARPSVYYEAGFAQRSIPVIYTVRKDHFKAGQPDNLRVHFDLQMKPIIQWENPSDSTFSNKLEKRLKATFLSKWERDSKKTQVLDLAIEKFKEEPVNKRLQLVRKKTIAKLMKIGFTRSTWAQTSDRFQQQYVRTVHDREQIINGYYNDIFTSVQKEKIIYYVSVKSFASITLSILDSLLNYDCDYDSISRDCGSTKHIYFGDRKSPEKSIVANIFVLSIKSVSSYQIEKVFTSFKPLLLGKMYARNIPTYSAGLKIYITYHFLTGIKSPLHLEEPLVKIINYIVDQKEKNNFPNLN